MSKHTQSVISALVGIAAGLLGSGFLPEPEPAACPPCLVVDVAPVAAPPVVPAILAPEPPTEG